MRPLYKCNGSLAVLAQRDVTSNLSNALSASTGEEWISDFTTPAGYHFTMEDKPLQEQGLSKIALAYITVYSIVFILATVGNSFVIATLVMNKRMGTVTNYFLLSLAVSDLMVALVCIPITLIGIIKEEFIFGMAMCKIMSYLMSVSVAVSTFTMVAISLERYYAICRPLQARGWQTKSHACKVILGIWIFSFLLMVPIAIFQTIKELPIARLEVCRSACRIVFPDNEAKLDHSPSTSASEKVWYVFQLIVLLCIPGMILSVAYGFVCKTIYNGFRFEATKQTEGREVREMKSSACSRHDLESQTNSRKGEGKSDANKVCASKQLIVEDSSSRNGLKSILKSYGKPKVRQETLLDDSRRNETRKQLEAKKKVVEMLIVIVLLFFICWTPTFFANVWKSFDSINAMRSLQEGIVVIQILRYVSTCVNPVVYCFLNKRFRRAFLNIFCICCGCLPKKCRPDTHQNQSTFRENRDVGY